MIDKTKIVKMNLSILGVYIRVARINMGISLRGLATMTNISHTLISNIEMGKQVPSEETLLEIMNALNLELNISDDISSSMSYYYTNIFENLLSYKYDIAKRYIDELETKEKVFKNSLEVINYDIITNLYYALTNSKTTFDTIAIYEEVINFLTIEQQQLCYFIKGVIYLNQLMFIDAESNLEKASELRKSEFNILINECLAIAYINQYKFTNSIALCNRIIDEYEGNSNYIRAMHARLLISQVYLKIMKFDEVKALVERVSQFANQFKLQSLLDECHIIKANVYFYWDDYSAAIKELDQVENQAISRYSYTRFRILLVSKDKSLKDYYNYITSDEYKNLTSSLKLLIKVLMKWQNKDYRDEAYVNEIEELKSLAVKGNDQELIGLTYNLLILYYKEDRKYKKALEVSEELLVHKKIHIKFYSIKPNTV